jgi:uncharacterized protein YjcR
MALVLRIKFPQSYPVIYKTLRIDSNLTVQQAIASVNETLRVDVKGDIGLYLPQEKRWLADDQPLSSFESLQDAVRFILSWMLSKPLFRAQEEVEFREKNAKPDPPKSSSGGGGSASDSDGCCVIS